jgi:hypothetical protein
MLYKIKFTIIMESVILFEEYNFMGGGDSDLVALSEILHISKSLVTMCLLSQLYSCQAASLVGC